MIRSSNKQDKMMRTAAQTAILMMGLTMISKGVGFVREMVLAGAYGTSYIVDAYVMADCIPSILVGGVFLAIGTAYTPSFSSVVERDGKEAGDRFTNQILALGQIVAVIAWLLCAFFSKQLVLLFAHDFSSEAIELTTFYLRITCGCMFFSGGSSILAAYLQYHNRFLQPIVAGVLYNVGIVTITVFCIFTSHYYLAFGLLLGYGLQFLVMFCSARKNGYRYQIDFTMGTAAQKILALSIPVFFSTTVYQINSFVDKSLAARLPEGSVAALNYSWILTCLITGMTATIISTILYPKLTKAVTNEDWDYFHVVGGKSVTVTVMIAVPLSLGAVAFSQQVVRVIYERGAFNAASTVMTGEAFFFYGIGIVFIALQTMLVHVYYSMRDMKTPIICSVMAVMVNITLNFALINTMAHCGLALASSVSAMVNTVALLALLHKRHPKARILPNVGKILRICICAVLAVGAAVVVYQLVSLVWMPRLCYLMLAVGASVLVYLILLKLFKIEELDVLKELIRR